MRQIYFRFFWLLFSGTVACHFAIGAEPFTDGYVLLKNTVSCDLPAPSNFDVTGAGPTWISLDWDAVPGALEYNLRTYDSGSNLIQDVNTSNLNFTVSGLSPGETYLFKVRAICNNGDPSTQESPAEGSTLIVDIIAGVPPTYTEGTETILCETMQNNQSAVACIFEAEKYPNTWIELFDAEDPWHYLRLYSTYDNAQPDHDAKFRLQRVYIQDYIQNYWDEAEIYTHDYEKYGENLELIHFTVKDETVFQFLFGYSGDEFYLSLIPSLDNRTYGVRILDGIERITSNDVHNDNSSPTLLQTPTLIHTLFAVELPTPPTTPSVLQLFDLNGKLVKEQQFPALQQSLQLNAAELRPGFYIARITIDGKTETRKVIKAE